MVGRRKMIASRTCGRVFLSYSRKLGAFSVWLRDNLLASESQYLIESSVPSVLEARLYLALHLILLRDRWTFNLPMDIAHTGSSYGPHRRDESVCVGC
jgi:hypothetical protein